MRVLVTGASGFIGAACLARLYHEGHALVGAGRGIDDARRRFPYAQWIEADFARLTDVQAWQPLLRNIDAVVNCVGVLQDGARDNTRRVHVDAPCALFLACARGNVRHVIHFSAIGASTDGLSEFSRTKAQAETYLTNLDLDWVILRPALVLGVGVFGGSAMLRGLAAIPWVTPIIGEDGCIQVVSMDDVAATVAVCLRGQPPARVRWDLAHPKVHSLDEIIRALRQWLGFPPQRPVRLPSGFLRSITATADAIGWLGWRSPARSTALSQIAAGVVGNPGPWIAASGIKPKSLDDILADRAANVQDRWFARLYLIKPVAIGTLALFWIASGVIALGPGRAPVFEQLEKAGVGGHLAGAMLIGGASVDIVLGLLLFLHRSARGALLLMLVVALSYLVLGTTLMPQLWLDPLGPLIKVVPLLLATLFTVAVLPER